MYRFRKQKLDLLILVEDIDIIKLYMYRFVEALTKVDPSYKVVVQSLYSQTYSGDASAKCEKAVFVLNKAGHYTKHVVEMCALGLKGNKTKQFLLTFGNTVNGHFKDIFLPKNTANATCVEQIESWLPDLICFIFPKCRSNSGNKYFLENRSQSQTCKNAIVNSMAKMGAVDCRYYDDDIRCKMYIIPNNAPVSEEDTMIRKFNNNTHSSIPTVILVDGYKEVSPEDSETISRRKFSLVNIIHCILFLADILLIHPDGLHSLRIRLWKLSQWFQGLPTVPARFVQCLVENDEGCQLFILTMCCFGVTLSAIGTGIPNWYSGDIETDKPISIFWNRRGPVQIKLGLFKVCFNDCYSHTTGWLITTQAMSIIFVVSVFLATMANSSIAEGGRTAMVISVSLEAFGGLASVVALAIFGAKYRDLIVGNFYDKYSSKAAEITNISGSFHASVGLNIIATLFCLINVTIKLILLRYRY